MPTIRESDNIAKHVGISAPETPKYLLANNFLLEYFELTGRKADLYNYAWFEQKGVLSTQDDQNKKNLEKAFNRFLYRYLGDEAIHNENNRLSGERHFYFPLMQDMLIGGNTTLRHMLFQLQKLDKKFRFEEMQHDLEEYIFCDNAGVNNIWRILFQEKGKICRRDREGRAENDDFWNMLKTFEADKSSELIRMRKLGRQFNEDLKVLLTNRYFTELDFYRKYHYLSILLTSYVIQYILVRKGENACLLCKGRPFDDRLNGDIHRACCYNYARLREVFPELLKDSYKAMLKNYCEEKETILLHADRGIFYIEGKKFTEVSSDAPDKPDTLSKRQPISYENLLNSLGMKDGDKKSMSFDEFNMRFTNLIGSKQGSTLQKMSSILSTSGKQIDMVYPKTNVNSKYFAMSEGTTEFYVRLYLARRGLRYDYLDNFIEDLMARYHIVITKINASGKFLKPIKPLLSAREFLKNKQAFLDTLYEGNCLIKLSDSGFIVTLPEEKGGFKLI